MNLENYLVGVKLKEFRHQAGFSLAKAAEQIGVSPAFISMVENGKCGISFQKARDLVLLYGKTLADISTIPQPDGTIINLNAAPEVASVPGVKVFGLVGGMKPVYYSGFRIYFEPGATHEFERHDGMEYVIVLEGTIEIHLQETEESPVEVRRLQTGDTTTFSAAFHHRYVNTSNRFGSVFALEIGK